jgi:hypothetical protein
MCCVVGGMTTGERESEGIARGVGDRGVWEGKELSN